MIKMATWGRGGRTHRWRHFGREQSVWWISTATILLMESVSMENRRLEKTSQTTEDWRQHTMLVWTCYPVSQKIFPCSYSCSMIHGRKEQNSDQVKETVFYSMFHIYPLYIWNILCEFTAVLKWRQPTHHKQTVQTSTHNHKSSILTT